MSKILLFFILILVIIILILFIQNKKYKNENFENYLNNIEDNNFNNNDNNNTIFLTKDELFNFLNLNIDNYYDTFTKKDLMVRNVNNVEQYIKKIYNSVSEFTPNEKRIIQTCINKISNNLDKIKFDYFDGEKANEIIWKIGCIKGDQYEDGLPHTRNDIIILNKNNITENSINDIISLLIHEKVHVYQKMYPEDINNYLKKNNFKRIGERYKINNASNLENIRANPDLDEWVYEDNNKIYKAIYEHGAKTVSDVKYSSNDGQKSEHPFEKMAIELQDFYEKNF